MPTTRLGRVALFTFAAVSVGAAACATDGSDDSGKGNLSVADGGAGGFHDMGGFDAAYGAAAFPGSGGAGGFQDMGNGGTMYGTGGGIGPGGDNGAGGTLDGSPGAAGGSQSVDAGRADAATSGAGGENQGGEGGSYFALYGVPAP